MLLDPIPSVTCGCHREFYGSQLKLKKLDAIIKHIGKCDNDSMSKYIGTYLTKKSEANYVSVAREIGVNDS